MGHSEITYNKIHGMYANIEEQGWRFSVVSWFKRHSAGRHSYQKKVNHIRIWAQAKGSILIVAVINPTNYGTPSQLALHCINLYITKHFSWTLRALMFAHFISYGFGSSEENVRLNEAVFYQTSLPNINTILFCLWHNNVHPFLLRSNIGSEVILLGEN